MLSPSDIVVRPTSLTERLAAEAPASRHRFHEPTPTTMAERFAPEAQKALATTRPSCWLDAGDPGLHRRTRQRARSSAGGLLIASILVSLIPTALVLALLWQGVIRSPGHSGRRSHRSQRASDQASRLALAQPCTRASGQRRPSLRRSPAAESEDRDRADGAGPDRGKSGEEVAFAIAIDSDGALPARSVIAIRAMPEGATFSQGRPYGTTEWNLRPDEIGDLRLKLPKTAASGAETCASSWWPPTGRSSPARRRGSTSRPIRSRR